jgi:hypothetical protein
VILVGWVLVGEFHDDLVLAPSWHALPVMVSLLVVAVVEGQRRVSAGRQEVISKYHYWQGTLWAELQLLLLLLLLLLHIVMIICVWMDGFIRFCLKM